MNKLSRYTTKDMHNQQIDINTLELEGNNNDDDNDDYESCGDNKICVPFYLCNNQTGILNINGENLIDVRYDVDKLCSQYLEQCCSIDNKISEAILNKPHSIDFKQPNCGHRNSDGIIFKITGHKDGETEYGEFPWMIAVLKQQKSGNNIFNLYQCGGSLIHRSVVLTAAHCVINTKPQDLIVRAGEWDTQTKDEFFPEQDNDIIEILIHNQFNRGALHNNIALLFTDKPFELGLDVGTICLPPVNMNFDYSNCFATGWGKDSFGQDGEYQVILKKIELPIIPNQICQKMLRTTRLGRFFQLHKSFICAGGEFGKDTCKGDGGGPLSCPIKDGSKDQFYQSGIVAWGIGCGDSTPGVYVNVAHLRSWIDKIFVQRGLDQAFYINKL